MTSSRYTWRAPASPLHQKPLQSVRSLEDMCLAVSCTSSFRHPQGNNGLSVKTGAEHEKHRYWHIATYRLLRNVKSPMLACSEANWTSGKF
jgi:hypothetical protein